MNKEHESPVINCAQSYIDRGLFSSVEWCVKQHGSVVTRGVVGQANALTNTPMPSDAIYRIYSMTKPVVSIAALQLIEQQKLKLSDPVANYIPAFANQSILKSDGSTEANTSQMTIEHLLTHRAGLSYDFLPDCPVAAIYREWNLADDGTRSLGELVSCLAKAPLVFNPGERWHYSYATDVLAHVVELAGNDSLANILQHAIFAPLGMHETAFGVTPDKVDRTLPMFGNRPLGSVICAPGSPQELNIIDVEQSNPTDISKQFMRGGHGLFSTCNDYMRFAEYLRTNRSDSGEALVSDALYDTLWLNRIPSHQLPLQIGFDPLYGYGWNLFGRVMIDLGQAMSITTPNEAGWAGAASTYFWVDRNNAVSGVVMSQFLGSSYPLGTDMHSATVTELSKQ